MTTYEIIVNIFGTLAFISLGFTFMQVYLTVNKLWKRKHERKVAESLSITGNFFGIITNLIFVIYFSLGTAWQALISSSLWLFASILQIFIGAGVWVIGQRTKGFWQLVKEALRLERKEAGDLVKSFFSPSNADQILEILAQIAYIDGHLAEDEKKFISTFAESWNIKVSWEEFNQTKQEEVTFTNLRENMVNYLSTSPPNTQVSQLGDLIGMLVRIDGVVSEEEELIVEELNGLIEEYVHAYSPTEKQHYHIAIVPQNHEQELAIRDIIPSIVKAKVAGGEAFLTGSFHSRKYAEIVSNRYRSLNFFSVVVEANLHVSQQDSEIVST